MESPRMMHSFDPQIAVKVGMNAAVIFSNITWWCAKNMANGHNVHDGRAWTYNSVRAWTELFPYMTTKQVRTALAALEDAGLIVSGEYNESAYDRTKWYAPNVELDLPHKATHSAPEGEPIPVINPDITKRETSVSLVDDTQQAFDAYNDAAEKNGWPKAQKLTQTRISAIRQRMKEAGGLEGWSIALEKASASDFLTGRKPTKGGPFLASLDFLLQQTSFTRLMEGNYDNRTHSQQFASGRNAGGRSAHQSLFDAFSSVAAERRGGAFGDGFGD